MSRSIQAAAAAVVVALVTHAVVVDRAHGAITASGLVTPDPTSGGDPDEDLEIGFGFNPRDVDPRGSVTVDGGSLLEFERVFIGADDGFFGRMFVTGDGTRMLLYDGGANTNSALEVGREGNGYLEVTDGAFVDLVSSTSDLVIGRAATSIGELVVRDPLTFLTLSEDILVGDAGIGRMTVSNDAIVRTTDADSDLLIGDKATGYGVLTVDGHLTTLYLGGEMTVGGLGIGELHISGGARVDADNAALVQAAVGTLGRVTLSDGSLDVLDLNLDGYLGGHGVVRGQVDVGEDGALEVGPGDLLSLHGVVNNQGAVTVTGGEVRFENAFANNAIGAAAAPGRVTLEDGTIRFSQALTNDGVISAASGANNIHGEITNQGTIVVASDTVATFNDAVTDNGGTVNVLARGNALFLADVTFTAASQVTLGLSAAGATNNSGQIDVSGALALDGALTVELDPGFTPVAGQSFELLSAAGGVTGTFATETLPMVAGLDMGLVYSANSVLLDIQTSGMTVLDGDFNEDGVVDAVDFAVWRDGLGTLYGAEDYAVWRANFGATQSAPAGAGQSVPEPGALVLLAGVVLMFGCGRPRRPTPFA